MASAKKQAAPAVVMEDPPELLALAMRALRLNGVDTAALLHLNPKTISRWLGGETSVGVEALGELAPRVYPHDPALATRMHAYAATRMADAGVAPPPPLPLPPAAETAPAPPPMPPAPPKLRVDAVVYAACEAMDATPRALKPALLAAFRRARELGLSIDDVERELSPGKGKK
jgi:hypothetical protein